MKALILAAGKGTRLKELTLHRPKPMLPVGNMTLLEHHLMWLRRHNITEIAINLHHAHEVITDRLGDGARYGVQLHYSYEERLMGTAGAAKKLEHFLDQRFIVLYGDVFTNLDLGRLARTHDTQMAQVSAAQSMTLALYQVPNPTECGLVEIDATGRVLRFVEKPPADQVFTNLANAGIMLCEAATLDAVPPALPYDFGHDLYPKLLQSGVPLFGLEVAADEYVIDIGTPGGYQRAQETWAHTNLALQPTDIHRELFQPLTHSHQSPNLARNHA
jgi:NDP-sugar pyrophosphorylase family protein